MESRTARLLWASGCIEAAELDRSKSLKFLIKPPVHCSLQEKYLLFARRPQIVFPLLHSRGTTYAIQW